MLRISTQRREAGELTIRVEGRLTAEEVPELNAVLAYEGPARRIDLSGLNFADASGIERLQALLTEGAELIDASPYGQQLLSQP